MAVPKALKPAAGNALQFDAVKIFSATLSHQRNELGERVTEWLHAHRDNEIVEIMVTQSSDSAFHCLTITVFYLL